MRTPASPHSYVSRARAAGLIIRRAVVRIHPGPWLYRRDCGDIGRRCGYRAGTGIAGATLLLLIASSTAGAATYPGERPTSEPLVRQAADVGLAFWRARGVEPCPAPVILTAVSLYDERDGIDAVARADVAECRVWLSRRSVRLAKRERPFRRREGGDSFRETLCATLAHELGHLAGLEHTAQGIMSDTGAAVVPHDCRVWRRDLDRRIAR